MKNLSTLWLYLDGKKTTLGMVLLFLYGGLSAVGVDVPQLKDFALFLGGVGLAHKGIKTLA